MYVAVGGAFGSMCRYLAGVWIGKINAGGFPLPTMVINITGSFLMGVWIGTMVLMLPGQGQRPAPAVGRGRAGRIYHLFDVLAGILPAA